MISHDALVLARHVFGVVTVNGSVQYRMRRRSTHYRAPVEENPMKTMKPRC